MAINPTRKMKFKLNIVVLGLLTLVFTILMGRILYISCFAQVGGVKYGVKAYNQQLGADTINANRGTIYDRNMNALARSATVWTVSVAPNQIDSDEKREKIASGLADILGMDKEEILAKTQKKNKYEIVKKKVEKPEADKITEFVKENKLSGVHMVEDSRRYYPLGNTASHVIGFTGSDNQGLAGVEIKYNDVLSGTPGKVVISQNALGTNMPFEYEYYYPAQDGNSLVLTLDQTLQHYVDKALKEAVDTHAPGNRTCAIMMDVNNGEIVAMSTQPDFDLNDPFTITDPNLLATLEGKEGDELKEAKSTAQSRMWTNKAISETYEPGSVFKVVTSSAALEEKTMTLENTFDCSGSVQVAPGTTMKCWKAGGHGHESFVDAVVNSCNPAFIKIGASLGPDLFYQYFTQYGMTEKTGIDLPGESKSLYVAKKDLGVVSLASESFGQSMSITPMQMLTAFCATVNGGYLVTPHVVKQVIDNDGNIVQSYDGKVRRQAISEETSETMRYILEQVVSANGGSNASVPGYRIAGKSGTAQKLARRQELGKDVYVSSFAGAVPADNPQYALLVMVDEPTSGAYYGGAVASPIFVEIMTDAIPYFGISPEYTEEELEHLAVSVPYLESFTVEEAKAKLSDAGLAAPEIIGSGDTVIRQVPAAGSNVSKDASVLLYTDDTDPNASMVTVPDVTNLTQEQARIRLTNAGLNISYSNTAVQNTKAMSTSQSPAAGESVPRGTVVTVEFLTNDETG